MEISRCCNQISVLEDGFYFCSRCGAMQKRDIRTCHTSFNQATYYVPKGYSRRSRFVNKVLGSLRLLASHNVEKDLFEFLEKKKINTPQELLHWISKFPTKTRRPYSFAMYYWAALGKEVPRCTEQDIKKLVFEFDNIMFAWHRLGFKKPCFPYAFLFKKLVARGTMYSDGIKAFAPFLRDLKCIRRRERYDKIFKKCISFDFKNICPIYDKMDEKKVDANEIEIEDKSEIYCREIIENKKTMSPYDAKGVYKTQAEIDRAIANGTFSIAKTMHVDKNGNIFFLVYDKKKLESKESIRMRELQLQERQKRQLEQAQKLNRLLMQQASL